MDKGKELAAEPLTQESLETMRVLEQQLKEYDEVKKAMSRMDEMLEAISAARKSKKPDWDEIERLEREVQAIGIRALMEYDRQHGDD